MNKRTAIRIISFCAAAVITITVMYINEKTTVNKYRLQLQNEYSRSLTELNSNLNSISLILQKSIYATTAKHISDYAARLYSEAELAKEALSKLPSSSGTLDTVNRFLSQVGNYALSVSKSMIIGEGISSEQKESLILLSDTAHTVARAIEDSQIDFNNSEYWTTALENSIEKSVSETALSDSLYELEEKLTDYPTLIYDGPYSDHILTKKPTMTINAAPVTRNEALYIAEELFDGEISLEFDGMENGSIEAYRFLNENVTAAVSKNGGYIVYMRKNRIVGDTSFEYEQALLKARDFLSRNGFSKMIDTYYYTDEGVCVINFAFLDGQTICYTDLMKVGVAMDTGEIMLFETSGYLANHTERFFEAPAHTSDEAAATLSHDLNITQTSIALIPTASGSSVRCYEFLCNTQRNEQFLIYINVQTLESEEIFVLLKTDGGTLVK